MFVFTAGVPNVEKLGTNNKYEVYFRFIFFFYGTSARFWAMASPTFFLHFLRLQFRFQNNQVLQGGVVSPTPNP
jgi:hypothetical protein